MLPQLVEMAECQDLLPALAIRLDERPEIKQTMAEAESQKLRGALHDNTRHNMEIVMQALKLARRLNKVGMTPTFLKGTAQLLTVNEDRLGFRKQIDIDLVVAPEEIEDTCEVLLAAGYGFCRPVRPSTKAQSVHHNIAVAAKDSAAHHHLPPLVLDGYGASVEVHRHFLPKRFQRENPLALLLSSAHQHESHGAAFKIPRAEYQVMHIVLGKMVHDGHLARRSFPVREACDYIELMVSEEGRIDEDIVVRHCGKNYTIFAQLVSELMAFTPDQKINKAGDIEQRMQMMKRQYNSPIVSKLLYTYARAIHLTNSLGHNPAKLESYLRRLLHSA